MNNKKMILKKLFIIRVNTVTVSVEIFAHGHIEYELFF